MNTEERNESVVTVAGGEQKLEVRPLHPAAERSNPTLLEEERLTLKRQTQFLGRDFEKARDLVLSMALYKSRRINCRRAWLVPASFGDVLAAVEPWGQDSDPAVTAPLSVEFGGPKMSSA